MSCWVCLQALIPSRPALPSLARSIHPGGLLPPPGPPAFKGHLHPGTRRSTPVRRVFLQKLCNSSGGESVRFDVVPWDLEGFPLRV